MHLHLPLPLSLLPQEKINAFQKYLREEGFFCSVRVTRGEEDNCVCGMLVTKRKKRTSSANEDSLLSVPSVEEISNVEVEAEVEVDDDDDDDAIFQLHEEDI
jgi:hypothetical protein